MGTDADAAHLIVGIVIAALFIISADKSTDDTDAGELLTEHLIHYIHLLLLLFEPGMAAGGGEVQQQRQHRHHHDEDTGELHILLEAHDDAADEQNGSGNDGTKHHLHHILDLVDVVGSSGDQRRGAKLIQIRLREGLNLGEQGQTHIPAIGQRGLGGKIGGTQSTNTHHDGNHQHNDAIEEDLADISGNNAPVDDLRVQIRQEQVAEGLRRYEHDGQHHPFDIGSHKLKKGFHGFTPCLGHWVPLPERPECFRPAWS